MKKPDVYFTITVNPVFHVYHCAEYQAQEERGLFGFHNWGKCPNCRVEPGGYEFWGENGHKQGGSPNSRHELAHRLRYQASRQFRQVDGRLQGTRIKAGSALYYVGGNL